MQNPIHKFYFHGSLGLAHTVQVISCNVWFLHLLGCHVNQHGRPGLYSGTLLLHIQPQSQTCHIRVPRQEEGGYKRMHYSNNASLLTAGILETVGRY